MTPTEAIAALEKALEAGPTPGSWSASRHGVIVAGPMHEFANGSAQKQIVMACSVPEGVEGSQGGNTQWIAAANPLAIRALLDAHAGALRDAERYRWLRQQAMFGDYGCPPGPHWWLPMFSDTETSGLTFDDVVDAARAALATNTRGAV